MRLILLGVLALCLSGAAYVRLAPSDAARWHVPIDATGDANLTGGAVRVMTTGPDTLARADAYMRDLPRTHVLAGGVEAGRITYITRSQVFGFPDYTTIEYVDGMLKAHARLRFGSSDMGVNGKRLDGLFAALERG